MDKKFFLSLGILTLFGFSAIGWGIIHFFIEVPFNAIFQHGIHWFFQILAGLSYGFFTGWIGWLIVKSKLLNKTRKFYSQIIGDLKLNIHEIIFISFCAGVGEEILFRGAVQYFLGVWITAVIFVAIHGYLSPMNWRISIYGAFMTVIIAGIGYMFEYLGLVSAISAHFAIDVVLLWFLTRYKENTQPT